MKNIVCFLGVLLIVGILASCDNNESVNSDLTGNEVTYSLYSGSEYNISGAVTMKERKDGYTDIEIKLTGNSLDNSNRELPVHLHLGAVDLPDAEVAALLSPVMAADKESVTTLTQLSDESMITFAELKELDACIKVHLSASGPESDIVLAGGNIGSAESKAGSSSRAFSIATCQSQPSL